MITRRSVIKQLGVASLVSAGSFVNQASLVSVARASTVEKLSLLLDFGPQGCHGPIFLAQEKGWFRENNLEVSVQDGRGSVSTIQLVGNGQFDIGHAQLAPVAIARQNGLPVKSIAGWVRRSDLAVIVDRDGPINKPQDLKGKRLVVFAASPWMQFFELFLANVGLNKADVTLLVVDPAAMMGTYASRQADAVLTLGPFGLPIAEKTRPSKAIWADEYGVAFLSYGIITQEQKIESRKEALGRFLGIQARAWKYVADGHVDEAVSAIMKQRPNASLDPVVLKGQLELYIKFMNTPNTKGRPIGWQSDLDWAATLSSMKEANFLKATGAPQANFTNEFIPAM